jgi:hypothetical protein
MPAPLDDLTRRGFLQATAGAAALTAAAEPAKAASQQPPADRPRSLPPPRANAAKRRLAVITTVYHYLSHSYHICGRFLHGYLVGGRMHYPDWDIASMHVAQVGKNDLSQEYAKEFKFALHKSVRDALTLGGEKLAVDGVLLIAEHGDYAYNKRGQKLYPRHQMFMEIVEVFRKSGRTVPVFCDKHLSYDRKLAREMVDTARKLNFPLMAGSSLPVTWRRPEVELPIGGAIKEALVVFYAEVEIYGIHALEALQSMVERRTRGQQGVAAVRCLEGDAVWKAGEKGEWSWELLEHALGRCTTLNVGDIRRNCRNYMALPTRPTFALSPVCFLIEYRDGLRAAALCLTGHVAEIAFAAHVANQKRPVSTLFYLPPPPGADFLQALTMRIEDFLGGRQPYPVERTLLTGGMLDYLLESRVSKQARLQTPDLDISYEPPKDSGYVRGEVPQPV